VTVRRTPEKRDSGGDAEMKLTATMGDGSVNDRFLEIWLHDHYLLRLEFDQLVTNSSRRV
jgi:hypothetical protein